MENSSDNEFLNELKKGNKKAFEKLYKDNFQLLWSEAFRILNDKIAAEDAVQDFFMEVLDKKLCNKIDSNIKAYLFTCIRRKCFKLAGRHNMFQNIEHEDEYSDMHTDQVYEQKELNNEIVAAMNIMSPQSSKVFELYILENRKRKEVALHLGLSDNTVKSYLKTAITIARQKLLNFKKDTPE